MIESCSSMHDHGAGSPRLQIKVDRTFILPVAPRLLACQISVRTLFQLSRIASLGGASLFCVGR